VKRPLKVVGVVVAALVLLGGGLLLWGRHELRRNGERIRAAYARELHRIRPAFLEDQELARRFPILVAQGKERDAGPFLNPRIAWDGDEARIERWRATLRQRPPPLGLDAALAERIPKDWWTAERELWSELDFSWMETLRGYDHWDVERNSPWRDVGTRRWPNGFPLFFDMTPWAKLRLAKGLAVNRPAEAVAEVEHLASLLLSTETLVGASTGLQYLGFVDQALGALEAAEKRPPASPNRMDPPTRRRIHRAMMAAMDFLRVQTPAPLRADAPRIVAGRCAAMNEALHAALATGALARAEDVAALRWLAGTMEAEADCRMPWVREAWHDPTHFDPRLLEGSCDEGGASAWACRAVRSLPFARALERWFAAEALQQMAVANYARHPGYP
jgi:hypothetical protein